jgi:hypothetical protein
MAKLTVKISVLFIGVMLLFTNAATAQQPWFMQKSAVQPLGAQDSVIQPQPSPHRRRAKHKARRPAVKAPLAQKARTKPNVPVKRKIPSPVPVTVKTRSHPKAIPQQEQEIEPLDKPPKGSEAPLQFDSH